MPGERPICADCESVCAVRYRFAGEPVFWTCERCGIRDESELFTGVGGQEVTA